MNTIDLIQGSPEWHAHRATHFNASDAPAMMGCSPYMTRNELLHRLKTGIAPEVDAGTQRRFDDGHRFEALARPLAQDIIGEELYPVTGTNGKLSASFDGLALLGETAFEHKTLNAELRGLQHFIGQELPLHYRVQMEHQMLVSGAERVLFMASKWNGETLVEERHCWYASDPELANEVTAGWVQFAIDLAAYTPTEAAAPVVAAPVETLPAVSVKVEGELAIVSNLPAFGEALRSFIGKIPEQPSTDQEFADTEAACKALKKAEEALDAAENNALAQLADVDTMRRFVADYKSLARTTRLQREKLVAQRKDAIRLEIVQAARDALIAHSRKIVASMPADYMPAIPADFAGCIKGLKSLASIQNAVDTELARAKIAADEVANRIHAALKTITESGLTVHDTAALVLKAPEDLAAVLAQREAAEKEKEEAQRARIIAQEQARLEAEARAKVQAEEAARKVQEADEADRLEREKAAEDRSARIRQEEADRQTDRDAKMQTAQAMIKTLEPAAPVSPAIPADTGARLTLGQINERLAPVSINVAGLAELGFDPVEQVKASRLYRESDLPAICRAIAAHVTRAGS